MTLRVLSETFRECLEDFQLNGKTMCMQIFKGAYKQFHRQSSIIIDSNIVETFKVAHLIGN